MVTDPQTDKQTGPIKIHCAAKLSVQCKYRFQAEINLKNPVSNQTYPMHLQLRMMEVVVTTEAI